MAGDEEPNANGNGTPPTNNGGATANDSINTIARVKLPDFVEEHTDLWFWQVDSAFEASGITADKKKYNTIIGHLPTRVMYKLADLRTNPPEQGSMYNTLKQRITTEFADSTQTKITRLLGDMPLGDRKPSQLLAEMRSKAANTPVGEDLLKQLWLRNLPEQVRIILSADDSIAINTLATMADRVIEATRVSKQYVNLIQPNSVESEFMQQSSQSMNIAPVTMNPSNKLSQIEQQMVELTRTVQNLVTNNSSHRRNSFSNSNRPREKSPHPNGNNNFNNQNPRRFENCWWHFKFGSSAMKCKQPCNFINNQNANNQIANNQGGNNNISGN